MMRNSSVFVPLFACSLLLVMGALDRQAPVLSPAVDASFVAQPASFDPALGSLTPEQLLARAAANLTPDKLPWLCCKIWQKQDANDLSFEAEGRLVRGPNQCVRLEMTVRSGQETTALVTVSDGVGLAYSCRLPGKPAQVNTQKFTTPEDNPMPADQIELILKAHGCGGPHDLLKDLEQKLVNWQMASGTWNNQAVLRLTGTVKDPPQIWSEDPLAVKPRICHLYLDVQTLWPVRVEWWATRGGADFLFLQMEFRDPEINKPLSQEDCMRAFTFLPEE